MVGEIRCLRNTWLLVIIAWVPVVVEVAPFKPIRVIQLETDNKKSAERCQKNFSTSTHPYNAKLHIVDNYPKNQQEMEALDD